MEFLDRILPVVDFGSNLRDIPYRSLQGYKLPLIKYYEGTINMNNDILFVAENNIATISLNRPQHGNAFTIDMYKEVQGHLNECGSNESIRAVVIKGEGKNFCTGGDNQKFKELIETKTFITEEMVLSTGAMTRAVRKCLKPVIAMINGAAAGAGFGLALSCDFRIMSKKRKFITSFINMGFSGDSGLIYFLQSYVGIARTTEMLMTSKPVSASEAYELGLCYKVTEEDELETATKKLALFLADQPTGAIARQKDLINKFFYNNLEEFNKLEPRYMVECSHTKDHSEAIHSFLEKRLPIFTGK